jgi:hypothetical protein
MMMPNLSKLFSNRSIASKLAAMTIVGAICMALVAASVLLVARNQLITERTEKAQAIVDAVWQIADGFQQAAAAGRITEDEARTRFYAVASSVWYEGHYVFIYDTETGICVANPGVSTLLGKDMRAVKDANGIPFASMMMDIARQGGAGSSIRYTFLRSSNRSDPARQGRFRARLHAVASDDRDRPVHRGNRCVVLVDGANRFHCHCPADAAVDHDRLGDHAQRGETADRPEGAHGLAEHR